MLAGYFVSVFNANTSSLSEINRPSKYLILLTFAMYYSDGFPKVFKCENELVKATLMYLDDPDAPDGVAFIRWLAVQDFIGDKINWQDMI